MLRSTLCAEISLQPEVQERLQILASDEFLGGIRRQMDRMMEKETARDAYLELEEYFDDDADHMKMLLCQLECAGRVYSRYQEKDISHRIYIDTMKCFTRFLAECRERTGTWNFDRGWWTYRQISMNLFRLGELEYELKQYDGKNAVSIHIPSDADFRADKVESSLEMARNFFEEQYPDYKDAVYMCNSWLLAPELEGMVGEDSNIRNFQKRFQILNRGTDSKEYIEWLFQAPQDTDYQALREDTSLQRKVKQSLMNGGTLSTAFGILKDRTEK